MGTLPASVVLPAVAQDLWVYKSHPMPLWFVLIMTVGQKLTPLVGAQAPRHACSPSALGEAQGQAVYCSFPTAGGGLGSGAGCGHWEERQAHKGEVSGRCPLSLAFGTSRLGRLPCSLPNTFGELWLLAWDKGFVMGAGVTVT